ncbi:MAG: TonB family protein [Xanthomonadales bacterium]|nr:TonB family protein [Xanthomonadales bacterium]
MLLFVAVLCSGAEANEKGDADAKRLSAPSISDADECRDRIEFPSAPTYPSDALLSSTEGWVVVAFTLSSDGKVLSPRVESEKPSRVFGQSALNAIEKVGFKKATGDRKCRILSTFTLSQPAAHAPVSLYCDGHIMRDSDNLLAGVAGALLRISANDFSLDIEGLGHGEAKGKFKRANAFELSGPVLFTPSEAGTAPFEALVVLQKYSGQLALRIPGDKSMSGVRYSGECTERRPLVDSMD